MSSCFRGAQYLPGFLDSVARQEGLEWIEVVLVLNEPGGLEMKLCADFDRSFPNVLRQLVVNPVEPVSVSMNRALAASTCEYVAIWNVDDLREDDSLLRQVEALDSKSRAGVAYGDMVLVKRYGSRIGPKTNAPPFNRRDFMRSFYLSAFPMWRRELCASAGLFDEQLHSGADFDLAVRLAAHTDMVKVGGVLGYYLNACSGLSTCGSLQPIERTVVELRYGIFDKVDRQWLGSAREYRIGEILYGGVWHPVTEFIPDYEGFLRSRQRLWWLNAAYQARRQATRHLGRASNRLRHGFLRIAGRR